MKKVVLTRGDMPIADVLVFWPEHVPGHGQVVTFAIGGDVAPGIDLDLANAFDVIPVRPRFFNIRIAQRDDVQAPARGRPFDKADALEKLDNFESERTKLTGGSQNVV